MKTTNLINDNSEKEQSRNDDYGKDKSEKGHANRKKQIKRTIAKIYLKKDNSGKDSSGHGQS